MNETASPEYTTLDTAQKLADNAFETSTKYTTKAFHIMVNAMIIGWVVTLVLLVILFLK